MDSPWASTVQVILAIDFHSITPAITCTFGYSPYLTTRDTAIISNFEYPNMTLVGVVYKQLGLVK